MRRHRFVAPCAAACLLCIGRVCAQGRAAPTIPLSGALNTYVTLATLSNGIDDKSYLGLATGVVGGALGFVEPIFGGNGIPDEQLGAWMRWLSKTLHAGVPPDALATFYVSGRAGESAPIWSPSVLFDLRDPGVELGAQGFTGGVRGFGVAGRIDLSHSRALYAGQLHSWLHTLRAIDALAAPGAAAARSADLQPGDRRRVREAVLDSAHQADLLTAAFLRAATGWRTCASVSHLRLSHLGTVTDATGSIGRLWELPGLPGQEGPSGAVVEIALQARSLAPEGGSSRTGFRAGLALSAQDAAPYRPAPGPPTRIGGQPTPTPADYVIKGHWRNQVGIEYVPHNGIDHGDTFTLFLRHRTGVQEGLPAFRVGPGSGPPEEKLPTLTDRYRKEWEFTLAVGKGPDSRAFGLLRVGLSL